MTRQRRARWTKWVMACVALGAWGSTSAVAQPADPPDEPTPRVIAYGPEGLEFRDADNDFKLVLGGRVQFRYASPFEDDPLDPEEIGRERETLTQIRRARFRASGHMFSPKVTFNFQYDLVNMWLLDARVNYEVRPWLQLRAGQWKADFNRERVASSSEQQMVERSIVNRVFTIDRQNGAMVHGRVGEGHRLDSTYWVGVFNGGGRSRGNDDRRPLWVARYQWNVAGGGLGFAAVDFDRTRKVRAILAVGASGNQSAYSRFASDGAGQVEDLPEGRAGQYSLSQWVAEGALKWRGVSVQHEFHWKQVSDRVTGTSQRLTGFYLQGGVFAHEFWTPIPRPLEFTSRYATMDPDLDDFEDQREEVSVGANWFLNRHRNKFSVDASRIRFDTLEGTAESSTRVRLQWDVSF